MADLVVDSLITKLEYEADTKTLREAEAATKQLEQQSKAAAAAADKLAAENRKLAEHTDTLTKAQIDLSEQIAESTAKTDKLVAEQKALEQQIDQAGGATAKQTARLLELDDEIQASKRHTKDLREENARLGVEKRKVAQESRKVSREQKDVQETSRRAANDQRRLAAAMRDVGDAAGAEAGILGNLSEKIAGVAGGQLAADALRSIGGAAVELGKEVITTGANFESLRARLKTVEGSTEAAGDAFRMIQDFAKATPFEVENITEAFTQLRVRGVQPTTDKLTALGDLSSAFGQDFKEMTDAIGAAARGELDPIEKFGIAAKVAGDKISLSFKGQTVQVERSASAVTDALVAFGKMNGIQGAMAEQSLTTAGIFSNLKDMVGQFFDQIAQMGVLDEVKRIMEALSASMGQEGLAQVIADVLVVALRTARELFEQLPQGSLIEFVQSLVTLIGMLAATFVDATSGQAGMMSLLYELGTLILDVINTVYGFIQTINEVRDAFGGVPGPITLIVKGLQLLLKPFQLLIDLLKKVLERLDPFFDRLKNIGDRLPSISDLFSSLGAAVSGLAADVGILNDSLATTESVATAATRALQELAAQNDYTKKTDAELQELRKRGDEKAEAEIQRRINERTKQEEDDALSAKQKKSREATFDRAERLLANPGRLSRDQLVALTREPFPGVDPKKAQKLRDKAQKEIDKRDNKRAKDTEKARHKEQESLVTAQAEKKILELAKQAGAREAARALRGGASPEEANRRELERREQVETQLTNRFRATGELPPGIAQDLVQIANAPNIEQVGGSLAPPVITVNNQRITVAGNTFEANVSVDGTASTPAEIADAVLNRARPVTFEDLGRAIANYTTTLRR